MENKLEISGRIESIEKKKAKNGKDFLKFLIVGFDGTRKNFNVFNMDYEGYSVGEMVKAIYTIQDNGYPNLIGFEEVTEKPSNTSNDGFKEASEVKNKEVDWEEVTRGKIRSLLLQSNVAKHGLKKLTDDEKDALEELVEIAVGKNKTKPNEEMGEQPI